MEFYQNTYVQARNKFIAKSDVAWITAMLCGMSSLFTPGGLFTNHKQTKSNLCTVVPRGKSYENREDTS